MHLKQKIVANELTIGSWITIGSTSIPEILSSAGFDWLTIDMEHSSINLQSAQELIIAIKSKKISPLIRVGKNDELIIKQAMDIGADGVIVPMVNNKEDALQAVSSVKYPPMGNRGVGLYKAQNYGIGFDNYKSWLDKSSIVIAQIEHIDGVNNIDEIISVEGIDAVIIGPYDLSASLGIPGQLSHYSLMEAMLKVETACFKKGKTLGSHVIKPDHSEINEKIKKGYRFIGFSIDFYFLGEKARVEMKGVNR